MIRGRCSLLVRQYLWFRSCTGAEETSWSSTATCLAQTVTLCWRNTQSLLEGLLLGFVSWITSYFYFIPRSFRKCLFIFFSSPPPFLCNFFWDFCFVRVFSSSLSSLYPSSPLQVYPSSLPPGPRLPPQVWEPGNVFYSNGQIAMRTMKITRKDLIFVKQNLFWFCQCMSLWENNFLYCT